MFVHYLSSSASKSTADVTFDGHRFSQLSAKKDGIATAESGFQPTDVEYWLSGSHRATKEV